MTKKNKCKDLFDTLNLTYEKYSSSQMEEKILIKQMKEELSKKEKEIKYAYQERINLSKNNCHDAKKELELYKKQLEKYSTFDSKMIGNILERLVNGELNVDEAEQLLKAQPPEEQGEASARRESIAEAVVAWHLPLVLTRRVAVFLILIRR